jgi:hypothetical protein
MKCDKCSSDGAMLVEYFHQGEIVQTGWLCKQCNNSEIVELWGLEDENDDN